MLLWASFSCTGLVLCQVYADSLAVVIEMESLWSTAHLCMRTNKSQYKLQNFLIIDITGMIELNLMWLLGFVGGLDRWLLRHRIKNMTMSTKRLPSLKWWIQIERKTVFLCKAKGWAVLFKANFSVDFVILRKFPWISHLGWASGSGAIYARFFLSCSIKCSCWHWWIKAVRSLLKIVHATFAGYFAERS